MFSFKLEKYLFNASRTREFSQNCKIFLLDLNFNSSSSKVLTNMKSMAKSILCFEHFSAFGRIANITNDILMFLHLHALYIQFLCFIQHQSPTWILFFLRGNFNFT